jgi:uncharacterized protein YcgI (DUF1989 family)
MMPRDPHAHETIMNPNGDTSRFISRPQLSSHTVPPLSLALPDLHVRAQEKRSDVTLAEYPRTLRTVSTCTSTAMLNGISLPRGKPRSRSPQAMASPHVCVQDTPGAHDHTCTRAAAAR